MRLVRNVRLLSARLSGQGSRQISARVAGRSQVRPSDQSARIRTDPARRTATTSGKRRRQSETLRRSRGAREIARRSSFQRDSVYARARAGVRGWHPQVLRARGGRAAMRSGNPGPRSLQRRPGSILPHLRAGLGWRHPGRLVVTSSALWGWGSGTLPSPRRVPCVRPSGAGVPPPPPPRRTGHPRAAAMRVAVVGMAPPTRRRESSGAPTTQVGGHPSRRVLVRDPERGPDSGQSRGRGLCGSRRALRGCERGRSR